MKSPRNIALSLLTLSLSMTLAPSLTAQQAATSDVGRLDKESVRQAFKARPYSPYAADGAIVLKIPHCTPASLS